MEYPIFDTHAHYSARAFDADRFALLDSLPGKGVVACASRPPIRAMRPRCWSWPINIPGCTPPSASTRRACWPRRIAVRKAPPLLFRYTAATGPQRCVPLPPITRTPRWWLWGSADWITTGPCPRMPSWRCLRQIRLALELDKPIIVHDRSAHADVYALLKKYRPKGIVHCYSGSADDARSGWQSRDSTSALAEPAPSRVPSGPPRPLPPCRWNALSWKPTAPMAPEPVRGTRSTVPSSAM